MVLAVQFSFASLLSLIVVLHASPQSNYKLRTVSILTCHQQPASQHKGEFQNGPTQYDYKMNNAPLESADAAMINSQIAFSAKWLTCRF